MAMNTSFLEMSEDTVQEPTKEESKEGYCQYVKEGITYKAVGGTVSKLPYGSYEISIETQELRFHKKKVIKDTLLKLPDSKSAALIEDVISFWSLKESFQKSGFRHSRGYFLYGPPGSGKSCTLTLLEKELVDRGGLVLTSDSIKILIMGLQQLRQVEPDVPVAIFLEDFERKLGGGEEIRLLSLLDGEDSIDNCVIFATTNYPEKFPPRFFNRPGRFFDRIYIGMPSAETRRVYLTSKEIIPKQDIENIVNLTENLSIDHLKALVQAVYLEGRSLEFTIKRLKDMREVPKMEEDNEKI